MAGVSGVGTQKTIEQIIESQATTTKEARRTGELGKNEFLQLLITQVQYQDPLNPASDQEFIAQLAQFSALEQMQNLNKSFAYSTAFGLMGKYITAEVPDETTGKTQYVSGIVDMVRVVNGEVNVVVNGVNVPIDRISQVFSDHLGDKGDLTDYSGIIGMWGKTRIFNDNGDASTIEGIISSVAIENGVAYARLDEVEIEPYDLDIGSYESVEEYVKAMAGKEVTLKLKDKSTGAVFKVTGTLFDGYIGNDEKVRLILSDVKVPAANIYSAKKVDLLSPEQLLLSEILKELRNMRNPGNGSDTDDGTDTEN